MDENMVTNTESQSEQVEVTENVSSEVETMQDTTATEETETDTEKQTDKADESVEEEQDKEQDDKDNEGEETAEDSEDSKDDIVIPVKFNKQYRELSFDEAVTYAQKGMKYDDIQPSITKLNYLAAQSKQGFKQFVEDLYKAHEEHIKSKLREKAGDDEQLFNDLLELERSKSKKAYEELVKAEKQAEEQEKQDEVKRVAGEYEQLKKEFPEYDEFSKVPKQIIQLAQKHNITLLDAKLRYDLQQSRKAETAKKAQQKASKSTTGSMQSEKEQTSEFSALLRGIWGT